VKGAYRNHGHEEGPYALFLAVVHAARPYDHDVSESESHWSKAVWTNCAKLLLDHGSSGALDLFEAFLDEGAQRPAIKRSTIVN
jgi:hypothetical protein